MSKQVKVTNATNTSAPALVPKLRFPEFLGSTPWVGLPIRRVASLLNGFAFKSSTYVSNGYYKIITIGNVHAGSLITENANTISDLPEDIQAHQLLQVGDILISMTGNVGRVCVVDVDRCLLNQRVGKLESCGINRGFFYQSLNNDMFKDSMQSKAAGGAQGNLSTSAIGEHIIFVPPKDNEQQKIASCLSSLDELIAAEASKVAALKAYKRGLMQQLFPAEGQTIPALRFPEFRNAGEWVTKSFGDLFTIGSGKDYKHLSSGDVPVYGSGGYMLSVNDFLHEGESVCIGRKGTINNPIFLTGKFWTVDTLFYTHSFKECLPRFIYLIFQNIEWLKHNEAGGVPSLSKTNIEKICVAVPKEDEQQKIADCLSSLDELIAAQASKVEALKAHKKGLMQQLFPSVLEDAA